MTGVSGRLILNLETISALAVLAILLARGAFGSSSVASTRTCVRISDLLRMATLAVLCIAVFWRAAHSYFLSDDFILVTSAPGAHSGMFTHAGGDGFFRPLGYLSLYWTAPWAGFDPVRWHGIALSLHIANALLVYLLAAAIGLASDYAWLAAALFALHGAHPEAVVWTAGRFDLLATMFALIALLAFLRLWEKPSALTAIAAGAAMLLGMLTKESAYATPLMMLTLAASRPSSWARRIRFLAPFFLLTAAMFAYRWMVQGGIGGYLTAEGQPQILSISLLSIFKALVLRLWAILFFPVDWAAPATLWLGIALVLYAAAWLGVSVSAGKSGVSGLALGLILAAAIPPIGQLLIGADLEKARLLYLPSVGFCLLAASVVEAAAPRVRAVSAAAMLLFSLAALLHNLGVWDRVSAKSKTVCEALAACSNPQAVTGLPRSLEGVYFFANGLPECVRLEQSRNPQAPRQVCTLHWDEQAGRLVP